MKVAFFHVPGGLHTAYQDMLLHPPESVTFINARESIRTYSPVAGGRKSFVRRLRGILGMLPIPNVRTVPKSLDKADIIYASQIIPITHRPWILDLELPMAITRFKRAPYHNPIHKALLRKALLSDGCKAITTWSDRAKKGLLTIVPEAKSKVVVIRPSITINKPRVGKRTGKHILFVGIDFERKGGPELLMAFRDLRKKVKDATLTMITKLPPQYDALAKQPGVTVINGAPIKDIYEKHYPHADIFILPTLQDTYGLAILEAMAHNVAVITTDDYATGELIKHRKTGLLIKGPQFWFTQEGTYKKGYRDIYPALAEYRKDKRQQALFVAEIASALALLLKNPALRKRMAKAGQQEVLHGRLSAAERNRRLKALLRRCA